MASQALTWGEAAEQFRNRHGAIHHALATKRMFRNVLGAFGKFLDGLGRSAVIAVRRDEIEEYQRRRLEAGSSRATVNADLRHLRAFLRWAVEHELIGQDPSQRVKFIRETRRIGHRYVSPEEIRRAVTHCRDTGLHWYADAILVVANTGLRLGELLNLLAVDLDIPARRLYVRNRAGFQTKDKQDRVIPLNSVALDILARRSLAAGDGPLFVKWLRSAQKTLLRVARRLGIPKLNWYSLRHSFATHAAEAYTQAQHMAIMGHEDPSTSNKYYVHREMMRMPAPPAIG